ncbi:TetR/AcrR family transcriptional regulator [Umezawaea sp. Da 62-37]|uniref:TetR/AcrR family transcriptional regulator n=1 Tax=Umezawaea sp. Da 62-37 TaxID=3075927 RepID=UPI0028F72DA3|nr:TetR/AcrR family transcriptional regulator [Umezawaea sp. Da 62-37]WNV91398.1 TetR/AcrR family transcriptional regulator [Umezawaea sp. Da 62-37]
MSQTTHRERLRAETERDIRRQARALLVDHGREAVTLRAIAREVGITAPALYRYYDSREDLLRRLCDDICQDLEAELYAALAPFGEGGGHEEVYAVCRGFRRWALAHPQEFSLVFASPENVIGTVGPDRLKVGDQFGKVFLEVAGRLIVKHEHPRGEELPEPPEVLHADLRAFRQGMIGTVTARGVEVDEESLRLGTLFQILQSWVRLYGHVALEVFGHFPVAVSDPEPMFDAMLASLLVSMGIEE